MLTVLLKQKSHIDNYCTHFESELQKDVLELADWKKLCTIKEFLQPFSQATLFTEGDRVSIDRTLFTMDVLIKHLQETLVSPLLFYLLLS